MKTGKALYWIATFALAGTVTYGLTLLVGTPRADAGASSKQPQSSVATQSSPASQSAELRLATYEGVITDTHCGAKHAPAIAESAGDCARACVHSGEHFALVDGDKMYALEGEPEALKRAAGERVTISGTLSGHTIAVTSVRSSKS
jgi:hypothetical protein